MLNIDQLPDFADQLEASTRHTSYWFFLPKCLFYDKVYIDSFLYLKKNRLAISTANRIELREAMKPAEKPDNEQRRLKLLNDLNILNSEIEESYDSITSLAADICQVPISLVSLVDEHRQWFKSKCGLDAEETPRDLAFCAHTILSSDLFTVPNALEDDRFTDNPLVTGVPKVIFYAGHPLEVENDLRVGTLCVIDHKPRQLTDLQKKTLKTLSLQVVSLLKLRMANKKLRDYLDLKETMFSTMSHEIRTPLNGILGLTEVLLADSIKSKSKQMISDIKLCGEDLVQIVNSFLDFSKLESGKVELHNGKIDLKKTLDNATKMFQQAADNKNIELKLVDLGGLDTQIEGDEFRLKQAIQNLLSNALKYTDRGHITIEVEVVPGHTNENNLDHRNLRIAVKDTGIGIRKKDYTRVFEGFRVINSDVTYSNEGTGLGLSISKSLIELMGGSISVESEYGKGSRFTIDLNIKSPQSALPKTESEYNLSKDYFSKISVLVAEDNAINQFIIKAMLENLGCQVTVVENGQKALDSAIDKFYDVIFLDCSMPVMDGYIAASKIKALNLAKAPYIVALTANATHKDRQKCLDSGMDDFLAKPATKSELRRFFSKFAKSSKAA